MKYFISILISIQSIISFSQNELIDSLQNSLTTCNDTSRIEILNSLSKAYININPQKGIQYAHKAIDANNKIKNDSIISIVYNNLGRCFFNTSNYDSALVYYSKALDLWNKSNFKKGVGICCNNIGNIYELKGNDKKAFQYLNKALEISEELKNNNMISVVCSGIADIHYQNGNFNNAFNFYERSMKIAKKTKNKHALASSYINISRIYFEQKKYENAIQILNDAKDIFQELNNLSGTRTCLNNIGIAYKSMKNYTKAIECYKEANKIALEFNNTYALGNGKRNIGSIYMSLDENKKALNNYFAAVKLYKQCDANNETSLTYKNIGNVYSNLNMKDSAVIYYNIALEISKNLFNKEETMEIYHKLSAFYETQNNFETAYRNLIKFNKIKDSIYTENTDNKYAKIQTEYETKKKEIENKLLKQKNNTQKISLYGLILLIVLIIGITIMFIRQNKLKALHKTIELEHKLLRLQINPHFMFNTLTNIQNFIMQNSNSNAIMYLSSFAKLLRLILENSRKEYVVLSEEVKTLEYYLQLQSVRFSNMFTYNINIDENIDEDMDVIPPMLAQPFIENSIEHGIMNKETPGEIDINFTKEGEYLKFIICDNGIGRDKANKIRQKINSEHNSLATIITNERIQNINQNSKLKASIKIIDLKNDDNEAIGTKVLFAIPFKNSLDI